MPENKKTEILVANKKEEFEWNSKTDRETERQKDRKPGQEWWEGINVMWNYYWSRDRTDFSL